MIVKVLDFDEFPGLRHYSISENSGEEFYHKILNEKFKEAFEKNENLTVDLDGVDAYASSFLDEAFGNLVFDFTLDNVKKLVSIKSEDEPHWVKLIEDETYMQWEERRIKKIHPLVTFKHEPWYRYIEKKIEKSVWELPQE